MITNFELFKTKPIYKEYDYVIGQNTKIFNKKLKYFLENNVGKIVNVKDTLLSKNMLFEYNVKFNLGNKFQDVLLNNKNIITLNEDEIRFATSEEINDYLFKSDIQNFNL